MKRKILMMCSVWHEDYIDCLLKGIKNRIGDEDLEVHVFMVYDALPDSDFLSKEQEIFSIPDLNDYDGILIAVNSVGNVAVVQKIIEKYKDSGKQILSIDQKYEGTSFIGIDNYQIFYDMVEHLITVHNCKVFNYLGGPKDHEENRERYRAFCDCLAKYHLPIEETRVRHCRFLNSDGINSYEAWKKDNMHLPDAVVCANDYMALGYLSTAEADGYQSPNDFRIVGFDNFEAGQFFIPSLTSVNRNWEKLGYESLDKLLLLIDGKIEPGNFSSPGKLALNESCGCALDKRDIRVDLQQKYKEKRYEERLEIIQRMYRERLCSSGSVEDVPENLKECFERFGGMDIVLCLKRALFKGGNIQTADKQPLIAVSANGQGVFLPQNMMEPAQVLEDKNCKLIVFTALHFSSLTYGFAVMAYYDKMMPNNYYRTFKDSMGLALENIRQREELRRVNRRLQELYVQDSLTGLYNRFGYMNLAEEYFVRKKGEVYLVYIDVDNLKAINDDYEHAMGDKAIIGVAQAMKEVFSEENIHVRMGGDEFLVLGSILDEDKLQQKEEAMRLFLEEYSERENLPFVLRVSMGHVCNTNREESLEVLVKQADAKMYEVKQKRKAKSSKRR